ncbi:DUF4097 family beta strand repeat-containing protein [Rhodohalobacter sp. 614A]|uniref:DUF4097 family beta strand repeat-containing protein n=1 Tax=Rhodohalobacter sp. 614A TaxID=2908649 RepID=UPI001F2CC14C|nr:DUF4097 family beta strand repeat-containing protein [Rhodohalobacter sp. 614A]
MIEKTYKAVIAFLVLVLTFICSADAQDSDRAYRIETFNTSSSPSVNVSTSGGSINVIGQNSSEVRVEMYVRRNGRYLDPSDTDLSDYDIEIDSNGSTVYAEAKRKGSGWNLFGSNRNLSISFVVYAPENSTVSGNTSGGSVSAEHIVNNLSLRTSGGSVNVHDVAGEIDLRTSGGSINIENADGRIDGRTSGGSVSARNVSGSADLRTSGGSIRLENISAKMSARTSGGSIRGEFLTFDNDIDLQTSGGNIEINLPEVSDFNIDLKGQRVNTQLRNFTGEFERDHVEGRIGRGGPMLTARTSGGSVSLRY